MNLQLLRNATQVLTVHGKKLLIDPMLAPKNSYDPFPQTGNATRNPVVDLPFGQADLETLIADIDAVLLTHLHLDHWDTLAQQLLPKDIPVFCQPGNEEAIRQSGFTRVTPVQDTLNWQGVQIDRTGGRHGTGATGERMGKVSGYVLSSEKERLYIAGDTIWCEEVQQALDRFRPAYIVLNGGGARFVTGDPIVMDMEDVLTVCRYAPEAKIYVVHLEAVNHAKESRATIKAALAVNRLSDRCFVPDDSEVFI